MNLTLINRGTEGEVLLEGRIISSNSAEVEKALMPLAERFDKVILNFEKLQYISSSGLRILRLMMIAMKKKDGEFVLTHVSSAVMEVLEMTGFAQILTIED